MSQRQSICNFLDYAQFTFCEKIQLIPNKVKWKKRSLKTNIQNRFKFSLKLYWKDDNFEIAGNNYSKWNEFEEIK